LISNCTVLFFWLFLVERKGDTMKGLLNVLAIQQLEGGTYTVDTILKVIKQITDWALAVGISLAGVALVISFIMYFQDFFNFQHKFVIEKHKFIPNKLKYKIDNHHKRFNKSSVPAYVFKCLTAEN